MPQRPDIYCALDGNDLQALVTLAHSIAGQVDGFKLGLEFFSARGPDGVRAVSELGKPIFIDLKLHDIPNTVRRAVAALAPLSPDIITVHASGGVAMLEAAVAGARESWSPDAFAKLKLVGVTVLTSMSDSDLAAIGVDASAHAQATRLAELAQKSGLAGVVCSPHEAAAMRKRFGPEFVLITPGVRPLGSAKGDQRRVMTPTDAARAGSNVLVIGRPITTADKPADAARAICEELDAAL